MRGASARLSRDDAERLLGTPVVDAERAPWGFTNHSYFVRTADGRHLVVQIYPRRLRARHRLRITARLGPMLQEVGISTPSLVRADLDAIPPWAVYERLPGEPITVVAGADLSDPKFPALSQEMGRLLPSFRRVNAAAVGLPRLWADPHRLATRASTWLDAARGLVGEHAEATLQRWILNLPELLRDRPAVLAHGDFGPANLLSDGGRITGVLDLELARLAHPLFDVAWWGWLVRFHTPKAFPGAWPVFLDAARETSADPLFDAQVFAIQAVRCLELVTDAARHRQNQVMWADRLRETLAWEPHA